MGNGHSCCISETSQTEKLTTDYGSVFSTVGRNEELSFGNDSPLPHISEREVLEGQRIESFSHPLFLVRSNVMLRQSLEQECQKCQSSRNSGNRSSLRKSSTCSTIFLDDSTISQPNLKNTIKCVALAIYYDIKNRGSNRELEIFSDQLHPVALRFELKHEKLTGSGEKVHKKGHNHKHRKYGKDNSDSGDQCLSKYEVYKFVETLFYAVHQTAACVILTLVYLERLLSYAEIDITPNTWKRITLGATLLATKVWDDQAVWNIDYLQFLKNTTVENMNDLERHFLELLQFNINVPSSEYAEYYYDLRTLAEANDLDLPIEQLSKDRAYKLEAMANIFESNKQPVKQWHKALRRKWASTENLMTLKRGVAILS